MLLTIIKFLVIIVLVQIILVVCQIVLIKKFKLTINRTKRIFLRIRS
ncbi:hypothetical protein [Fusobacterium polymorphum]